MLRSAGRDDVLVEETIPLTDDDDYTDDDDDDEGNTSVVSLGIEKKKKKKLKSSSSSSSTPRRRGYNDNHHHNDNYSYNTNDKDDDDDDDDVNAKLKKQLHHHWNIVSKTVREKVKKMDKDHMKFIALVVFVLMVMMQMSRSSRPPPSPPVSKRLRTSSSSSSSNAEMEPKKRINHNNNNDDDDTRDPTMAMASKNRDNLSKSDSLESLMSKQTTTKPSFMQPGLMQQQGFQTQQQMLQQQQQQQQQQALLQQGFMPQQQPGGFGQTMTPGLAGQPQQQGFPQMGMMTQDPQQTGLQQQQPGFHQQQGGIMMMQPQQQPGMMQQGGLLPQNPGGMTMQPQDAMLQQQQQQQQPGMMQPQNGMMQQQPQQQMGMLQQPGMMQPQQQQQGTMMMQGMGQQPPGMMQQQQQPLMQQQPGMNMMQQQPGLMMQGMPQQQPLVTTPMDTSMGGNAMMQPQQQQAGAAGMATTQMPLAAAATDGAAAAGTSVDRPSDADMEKVSQEIPLQTLVNFKETWGPYDIKDVPIFWHIPKAGGSTVKDVIGSCHRHTMATEFGVTDGHDQDKEIAVVYPRVPGAEAEDRSPFVNVDTTTVAGIQRANAMGFADSGLAGCVVTPFLYEANDLFTPTARGRLFSVFRHPVDRAISMFYYIQVATWEPTYKPELQSWTLEQYATSDVVENNWMVRQLSNTLGGDLDDGHLKTAMEVIRRKFLVGIMKKLEASMTRFEKFFRWKYHVNPTNQEVCRERLTSGGSNSNSQNKKSKPKPGEPVWEMLAAQNVYDMQLYEYIETLFEEQEAFVTGMPDDFRKIDATCCKCDPPTFPPEGFNCPKKVLNSDG